MAYLSWGHFRLDKFKKGKVVADVFIRPRSFCELLQVFDAGGVKLDFVLSARGGDVERFFICRPVYQRHDVAGCFSLAAVGCRYPGVVDMLSASQVNRSSFAYVVDRLGNAFGRDAFDDELLPVAGIGNAVVLCPLQAIARCNLGGKNAIDCLAIAQGWINLNQLVVFGFYRQLIREDINSSLLDNAHSSLDPAACSHGWAPKHRRFHSYWCSGLVLG